MRPNKQSLNSQVPGADREGFELTSGIEGADFWKQLLDSVDESISVHSATGELLHANKRLLEVYGRQASEVIGSSCSELFHTAEPLCPHEQVLEANQRADYEMTLDNGARVFRVTLTPIQDGRGRAGGYARILHEVTENRRIQEQLLRAEHFATLSQMISGIAHDLGTPLNIISGYSEYLLMRTKPEAQGHKELSTILQQTRRIADFIRHMLDLARPVQGRNDAIDLKNFFAESVDLMGHHFRKADVKVSIELRVPPPLFYGDAPGLKRAVFNLLLNAVHVIGQGGRLEIVIDESAHKPGFTMIVFAAAAKDGKGHDFSRSLAGFLSRDKGEGPVGMGLSLAREVLHEVGAEVDSFAIAERGVPLVVFLPKKKAGGQPPPVKAE